MMNFSTETVAPVDRFDHWREVRARQLFGVTLELPPDRRGAFTGSFKARAIGKATASEMKASAYRVSRTESDIARIAGNSLCIGHQVKGPGTLDTGRDRVENVGNDEISVSFSDLPYSATPHTENDFHFRMLKIPLGDELTLGQAAHDLFATTAVAEPSLQRPFRALFNAVMSDGRLATDPEAEIINVARLALALRGRLSSAMPEVRSALRSGFLHAALEIMERDQREAHLTAGAVAAELGISRRQLYLLFEGAELSFGGTLSAMRIRTAHDMLIAQPGLSVLRVALDCGFDSLATFYRLFGSTYAMTPGEARRTLAPAFPPDAGRTHPVI